VAPSSLTSSPEVFQFALEFTPEQRQALKFLSPAHLAFVERACKDPAFLDKEQFKRFEQKHPSVIAAVQAWPTLIGESMVEEMRRISVGLSNAIKRIPHEIFAMDAEAISEFYHLNRDFVRHIILPSITEQALEGAVGRGDYLLAPDKLWCVEYNMSVSLGGVWESTEWDRMVRETPVLADYLRDNNLRIRPRNSLRLLMRHVINEAKRYSRDWDGMVNVAYVGAKTNMEMAYDIPDYKELRIYFQKEYEEVLQEGERGKFILCSFEELWTDGGRIFFSDTPMNVVLEMTTGDVPLHILRCYQRGTFNLHNGPVTYLLCNKMAMALLSEFHDSGIFTEEEDQLVQAHVPWTRKVVPAMADFKGSSVKLPEFILENQRELVLKKTISASGQHVAVGAHTAPEQWDATLKQALADADWIVQECVKYPQLPYQHGTYGCQLHDVVFGLFVFGTEFGGTFMRVLAKNRGGVVNRQRGSTDAIAVEIL
jgi:hypothetical protein